MNDWSRTHSQSGRSSSSKGRPTLTLQQLGWNTLEIRRNQARAVMMYRIVNRLIAIPASLYLTPNTQNTRGHGCKFRVPVCRSMPIYSFFSTTTVFGFGTNCRLLSLCPFHRGLQVSIDGHPDDSDVNLDIHPVFISNSSTFLSVCGTWIYRLLRALHAHLPCTTLLNSEECALSEKKKKKKDKIGLG